MTAKELAEELLLMDKDVQNFEVGVISTVQIGPHVRLTAQIGVSKINPNADLGRRMVWLKAKEEI
jgi:hypothetical protein